jgi:nicotinamide mononucleotide transporter
MGSVAAQILLTQRKIENWVGWIAVDVLAIALYANRGLHLTAELYGLFLLISIWGFIEWRRTQNA